MVMLGILKPIALLRMGDGGTEMLTLNGFGSMLEMSGFLRCSEKTTRRIHAKYPPSL